MKQLTVAYNQDIFKNSNNTNNTKLNGNNNNSNIDTPAKMKKEIVFNYFIANKVFQHTHI